MGCHFLVAGLAQTSSRYCIPITKTSSYYMVSTSSICSWRLKLGRGGKVTKFKGRRLVSAYRVGSVWLGARRWARRARRFFITILFSHHSLIACFNCAFLQKLFRPEEHSFNSVRRRATHSLTRVPSGYQRREPDPQN